MAEDITKVINKYCNCCNNKIKTSYRLSKKQIEKRLFCGRYCKQKSMIGRKISEKTKQKMSDIKKGIYPKSLKKFIEKNGTSWNKDKKMNYSKEHIKNISDRMKNIKGEIHPRWVIDGSIHKTNGYNMIKIRGKWIREHHYVYLRDNPYGHFFIPKGWIIHHINIKKIDNRIENLIMMDRYSHNRLHSTKRWLQLQN